MAKRVVVIASGETERRVLPHLAAHLKDEGITVDVRIPSRNRQIRSAIIVSIVQSTLYDSPAGRPDKYVILIDTDGKSPEEALRPVQRNLQRSSLSQQVPSILYAYAQWHLEAWFFADSSNLRIHLRGRTLGNVDTTRPDAIENPKHHLQQLLGGARNYSALVSEQIASTLNAQTIAQRSPSFRNFVEAVRNGAAGTVTDS